MYLDKETVTNLINQSKKTTDIKIAIKQFMEGKIEKYPTSFSLYQCAYHEIYLGNSCQILCPICNNSLKFNGLKKGYAKNCSYTCRSKNPDTLGKYKETCMEKYGSEFASQTVGFRKLVETTCLEKYGVDNPMKSQKIVSHYKSSVIAKYGVDNISKNKIILDKIRYSHENSGLWTKESERTQLQNYRLQVKRITATSYYDHYYIINPDNLTRSRYQYHLDHIFSVEEGFKNNIPAEIIGHYTNLRMMWHLDNCRKNTKCHKSIEELYESYTKADH